ncbi:MAG: hypothetical protein Q8R21_01860, partial [Burkholderiales bacterium]|nr:hypothetical protein [Burkholderiales bacterium]
RLDGRVKRIHGRVARDITRGGLIMQQAEDSKVLTREWVSFGRRLQLNRIEKLRSDARGFVMEGNLPLQWVPATGSLDIAAAIRMPSDTILPNVDEHGRFKDAREAYIQYELYSGREIAKFPLWRLFLARLDPDNYDDMGSLGRPFLDASRTTWRKLQMTEEDLVIRRRTRAPLRLRHTLEGASTQEIEAYRSQVEKDQGEITTDFFTNKKGSTEAIQGDANLDQIGDVVHLLDTFFAGGPLPKGMMGYSKDLTRDILDDLKTDYYDEIDGLQDTLSFVYEAGFRLQLALKGINPDAEEFYIGFAERRTETPNQAADRALKLKALGLPEGLVWEELGYDAANVRQRREFELKNYDPYPEDDNISPRGTPRIKITPGNGRKDESATTITNK